MDDVVETAERGIRALGGIPEHVALALIAGGVAVALAWLWTRRERSGGVSSETLRLVTSSIHEQSQSVLMLSGTVGELSTGMLQVSADMQSLARQNAEIIQQNHQLLEYLSNRKCVAQMSQGGA